MATSAQNGLEEIFLFDESFLACAGKMNLAENLYDGFRGLRRIDFEELAKEMEIIHLVKRLADIGVLRVIEESTTENTSLLEILNQQTTYLEQKLHTRQFDRRSRDSIDGEERKMVEQIRAYTHLVYKTHRQMSNLDPRKTFSPEEERIYDSFLALCDENYSAHKEKHIAKKAYLKHHRTVGLDLNTDNKIIATSFALSYRQPIRVLTNDWDMERTVFNINLELPFDEFRERHSLPNQPRCQVDILSLSYCNTDEVFANGSAFADQLTTN